MAAIAILDDYQNVALSMADWSGLQEGHRIQVFNKRLPDVEAAAQALAGFEVIGIMRERTPFPRALFDKLPNLKLLVTTGKRNASIDLAAAKDRGVMVCNTGGAGRATAELAIGLMIALARHFRVEFQNMRSGRLADDGGLRPGRQDARPARARQPRRQGRAHRQGDRHEDDRLEREPHARAGERAGRRARRQGRAVPPVRRDLHPPRCCRRARAGWSARASSA